MYFISIRIWQKNQFVGPSFCQFVYLSINSIELSAKSLENASLTTRSCFSNKAVKDDDDDGWWRWWWWWLMRLMKMMEKCENPVRRRSTELSQWLTHCQSFSPADVNHWIRSLGKKKKKKPLIVAPPSRWRQLWSLEKAICGLEKLRERGRGQGRQERAPQL